MLKAMSESAMTWDFDEAKNAWITSISANDLEFLKDFHERPTIPFKVDDECSFYGYLSWFRQELQYIEGLQDFYMIESVDFSFFIPFLPKDALLNKEIKIFEDVSVVMRESGNWDIYITGDFGLTLEEYAFLKEQILSGLSKNYGIKYYKNSKVTVRPSERKVQPLSPEEEEDEVHYEQYKQDDDEWDPLFEGLDDEEVEKIKREMYEDAMDDFDEEEAQESYTPLCS